MYNLNGDDMNASRLTRYMEENDIVVNEIDMTSLEIDREEIKKKTTNAILVNIFEEIFSSKEELKSFLEQYK